jgi:polar amino acid transport system permease protein
MLLNSLMASLGYDAVNLSGPLAAILVLGLVQGAYASEIFRAAIQAIPYGQIESAKAFGLHGFGCSAASRCRSWRRMRWPGWPTCGST